MYQMIIPLWIKTFEGSPRQIVTKHYYIYKRGKNLNKIRINALNRLRDINNASMALNSIKPIKRMTLTQEEVGQLMGGN